MWSWLIDKPAWSLGLLAGGQRELLACLATHTQIRNETHCAEVDKLDNAQRGDAHEEAEQTAAIGQKVGGAVELRAA